MVDGRLAHPDRLGRAPPRPSPARSGPPGRGPRNLPAGAGGQRAAWSAVHPCLRHRRRGTGWGGLPAGRPGRRPPEFLVLARVLLAQRFPAAALALLERLHTAAGAQGRTGSIIEIRTLQALLLAASGEEASAQATLAGALTLASPQGYIRVFADEGRPMSALLDRLLAAQAEGHIAASG